jgi:hypothetical protein
MTFDCIYSVSVIEHVPCVVRKAWVRKFAAQLATGGMLLLTVDLSPGTDFLWNLSEGRVVEPALFMESFLRCPMNSKPPVLPSNLPAFSERFPTRGSMSASSVRSGGNLPRRASGLKSRCRLMTDGPLTAMQPSA